jgi:hypothetical protein
MIKTDKRRQKDGGSSSRHRTSRAEAEGWRRLVDEAGESPELIAVQAGVRPRVVQDGVERARALHDLRLAQQQQLAKAMESHQRDVLAEADRLRKAASWPPTSLVPEGSLARKKQTALLSHEKGLQSSIRAWTAIAAEHLKLLKSITDGIDEALTGSDLNLTGGARARLLDVVKSLGRGARPHDPGYSVETGVLSCGPYHILTEVSSLDDRRAIAARRQLDRLVKDVAQWDEVESLRKLHRRWETVRGNLVDSLEDIALRGLPAGRCRWCPGAPGVRARPLPGG